MRMRNPINSHFAALAAAAVILLICVAAPARADSLYSLDQTNYPVFVGQTVSVPVYLKLTDGDLATAIADEGLFGIGLRVQLDGASPLGTPNAAFVASDSDVTSGAGFDPVGMAGSQVILQASG